MNNDEIEDLCEIYDIASEVLGRGSHQWLTSYHEGLGAIPMKLLDTEEGQLQVIQELGKLHGGSN